MYMCISCIYSTYIELVAYEMYNIGGVSWHIFLCMSLKVHVFFQESFLYCKNTKVFSCPYIKPIRLMKYFAPHYKCQWYLQCASLAHLVRSQEIECGGGLSEWTLLSLSVRTCTRTKTFTKNIHQNHPRSLCLVMIFF